MYMIKLSQSSLWENGPLAPILVKEKVWAKIQLFQFVIRNDH